VATIAMGYILKDGHFIAVMEKRLEWIFIWIVTVQRLSFFKKSYSQNDDFMTGIAK
jgi:hypothetical protein